MGELVRHALADHVHVVGEAGGDWSSHPGAISLSSDGYTVAIGARRNDGNGGAGHARIYQYDDTQSPPWVQLGQDLDGDFSGDSFGGSVSLSGDGRVVAIGGSGHDGQFGHTKIYQYDETRSGNAVTDKSNNPKIGGDVKWAISPNAVLDLTINTDFAQADVDRAVNNLERFNIFFQSC